MRPASGTDNVGGKASGNPVTDKAAGKASSDTATAPNSLQRLGVSQRARAGGFRASGLPSVHRRRTDVDIGRDFSQGEVRSNTDALSGP
jgi:hypothetical protein